MDGIELLQHIKAESPDTEVIMFTGHGDMDLAIKSLKYDATDFVTKPINDEVLEIALKRARERIVMRRQLREYTENLERLVEEKARQLIEAERMAAVGQTVAELSHTIKNIANALKGSIFVLGKGIELDEKEYLLQGWRMVEEQRRENQEPLAGSAALRQIQPAPASARCDPNAPARGGAELMAAKAGELGVALSAELSAGLQPVALDPDGIQRCLMNLVDNAIDACRSSADSERRQAGDAAQPLPGRGRGGVPGGRQRLRHGRRRPAAHVPELFQHQGDGRHRHRPDDDQTDCRSARGSHRGKQPAGRGHDHHPSSARKAGSATRS
ncbi:MAG: response regulator [Desulfobacterales bacterium]|nr:response regulator [Desulfobacterales bacterium]